MINKKDFFEAHGAFSKKYEIHAEMNYIAFAAQNGIQTKDCVLYTTLSPCRDCAKLIIAAGLKRIVYSTLYDREMEGLELLTKNNIQHYLLEVK